MNRSNFSHIAFSHSETDLNLTRWKKSAIVPSVFKMARREKARAKKFLFLLMVNLSYFGMFSNKIYGQFTYGKKRLEWIISFFVISEQNVANKFILICLIIGLFSCYWISFYVSATPIDISFTHQWVFFPPRAQ